MWTFGKKVTVGFLLSFVVLVTVGAAAYQSATSLARTSYAVTQAHVVLEHLSNLLGLLKDAETGQRGFVLTGDEAFLEPHAHAVGAIPFAGYLLLLALGLLIAVVTFVCSMGNVPIARYLANAGIPLGANTTFIYGDLLVPPLIAIYRKTFPPRVAWTFVALFAGGAMLAGAVMEYLLGNVFGGAPMASMSMNDRFTLATNAVAIGAVAVVAVAAWIGSRRPTLEREQSS